MGKRIKMKNLNEYEIPHLILCFAFNYYATIEI